MKQKVLIAIVLCLLTLPGIASAKWIKDIMTYEGGGMGKVEYSHFNHLETLGKNCPTCHSPQGGKDRIFNIVRAKNPPMTMADMEAGKACGACHNGDRAFSVAEDEGNCSICHQEE